MAVFWFVRIMHKSLSASVTVSIGMYAVAYIYACTACVRTHTDLDST